MKNPFPSRSSDPQLKEGRYDLPAHSSRLMTVTYSTIFGPPPLPSLTTYATNTPTGHRHPSRCLIRTHHFPTTTKLYPLLAPMSQPRQRHHITTCILVPQPHLSSPSPTETSSTHRRLPAYVHHHACSTATSTTFPHAPSPKPSRATACDQLEAQGCQPLGDDECRRSCSVCTVVPTRDGAGQQVPR